MIDYRCSLQREKVMKEDLEEHLLCFFSAWLAGSRGSGHPYCCSLFVQTRHRPDTVVRDAKQTKST